MLASSRQTNIELRSGSKGAAAIVFHTKVYVLGDRFNITKLKDLTFSKITALFMRCGKVTDKGDVDAVMEAVAYAYDKLPLSVQQGPFSLNNLHVKERLLVYMARYAAWARDSLHRSETFINLLVDCPEFAVALIFGSIAAPVPPWVIQTGSPTKGSLSHDSTSHILSRSCGDYGYKGIMCIWCTRCKKYDTEVGSQIVISGTTIGEVEAHRLSGSSSAFTYMCKWCGKGQRCNQNLQYFNDPTTGKQHLCNSNEGSLVCRKCHIHGFKGKLSLI